MPDTLDVVAESLTTYALLVADYPRALHEGNLSPSDFRGEPEKFRELASGLRHCASLLRARAGRAGETAGTSEVENNRKGSGETATAAISHPETVSASEQSRSPEDPQSPGVPPLLRIPEGERKTFGFGPILNPPSSAPSDDGRAAALQAHVVRELGLEWDELQEGWWLPADPGPVLCATVEEALSRFIRMPDEPVRSHSPEPTA
jgi:hypothetical protein